jgi:hypothetical protein
MRLTKEKRTKYSIRTCNEVGSVANDRAFGGRILAAMSHQALHLSDVRHGLDFACAARAGTQGAVTPTIVTMLAAMEACAHAARGDASLCSRALSDAERAFARSTPGGRPSMGRV